MSDIGDRMRDYKPQHARTKQEADRLQRENEKRVQEQLAEDSSDRDS